MLKLTALEPERGLFEVGTRSYKLNLMALMVVWRRMAQSFYPTDTVH